MGKDCQELILDAVSGFRLRSGTLFSFVEMGTSDRLCTLLPQSKHKCPVLFIKLLGICKTQAHCPNDASFNCQGDTSKGATSCNCWEVSQIGIMRNKSFNTLQKNRFSPPHRVCQRCRCRSHRAFPVIE